MACRRGVPAPNKPFEKIDYLATRHDVGTSSWEMSWIELPSPLAHVCPQAVEQNRSNHYDTENDLLQISATLRCRVP
jgi:hypothetical protein